MINHTFVIKKIDQLMGPLLLRILPREPGHKKAVAALDRILIIRPGGMGDALLLLPVLKTVSKRLSPVKIDILCEPRNQAVFQAVPFINESLSYKNPKDLLSIFKRKYDIIIDTEQSHFLTAIVTRLIHADVKSGFCVNGRQKMYTRSMPYDHDRYEAYAFWDLLTETLNLNLPFSWDFPYFKPLKTTLPFNVPLKKYVCIFPGATINERLWPEQRWAKVMDWLTQSGWKCVLLGGKKELDQCLTILQHCKSPGTVNLCSRLTILETTLVLESASLLISTDSGPLHLGVLSNTATVSLFGPGIEAKWAPKGNRHSVINKNLDCSPCTKFGTTPPCPNLKACMLQITHEEVITETKKILKPNETVLL